MATTVVISGKPFTFARRLLAVLLLTALSTSVWADRPKIGLVLGGGGARGAAHIGVLKVLEQERIPVDYIAGTSMGAIVGSLYASGLSVADIEEVVNSIDWHDALTDGGPRSEHSIRSKKSDVEFAVSIEAGINGGKLGFPTGLVQGQRLEMLLRRLLIDASTIKDFDALPIPFRVVATDLATMQPMVFDHGDLARAVRASMSVPGAFEPVRYADTLLVDGGMVDNVPIDVAHAMGADILIVVDVRTPLSSASDLQSLGSILNQVINGLMLAETDHELEQLSSDDVYILPDLRDLKSSDFTRAHEAVPWGEEAANDHLEALQKLSMTAAAYTTHIADRATVSIAYPNIGQVNVYHASTDEATMLDASLAWQVGSPLDIDRLESSISEIYSDGRYSNIQYEVVQEDGETNLDINVSDKSWGPTIVEAALRVSDNFDGDSNYLFSVESVSHDMNSRGAKWINRARIGLRTGLFSEFYQPISSNHHNFLAPSVEFAGRNVNVRTALDDSVWRDQRGIIALDFGHAFANKAEIRLGYEYGYADTALRIGDPLIQADEHFTISQLSLEYVRDTLDNPAFPRQGLFLDIKVNEPLQSLGADATATAIFFDIYKPIAIGKGALLIGLTVNGLSNDNTVPFQELFSLGGITRLSGYQPDQLFGRYTGLASAVYYRRLGSDKSSMFGTPLYIGGSIETGGVWLERDQIGRDSLQLAGSVFAGIDSPVGPIYFGYGRAEGGVDSFYLTIGSLMRRLPTR